VTSNDAFEQIGAVDLSTVALLSVLKWVGATKSGLLEMHEVALVPSYAASEINLAVNV